MRSLFSFGESKEIAWTAAGSARRPEALRRGAIGETAMLMLVLSALAMPAAIYLLTAGMAVPFVVATLGVVAGMVSMVFVRAGQIEDAVRCVIGALLVCGAILALANPQLADFGLATALMAPVLASLLGLRALRRQSWWLLGTVLALAGLTIFVRIDLPVPVWNGFPIGAGAFLVAAVLVARAASRIGLAYQVYDRSQMVAFRHLMEHMQDTVVRFSGDGEVLFASGAAEALFGCRRYELTDHQLGDRIHVLDRPAYLSAFAQTARDGRQTSLEVRMRQDRASAEGGLPRFIWVEVSLSPIENEREPVFEVVALFRDITDRKDREAAVLEAQRAAEAASEAKSRFLATMGHELRTPLNAVVGFSEMMMQGIGGDIGDTHREYAGLIHQSGRHLLEVVGMLLDMSKIEAGRFELQTERLTPETLIAPCLSIVEPMARVRDVAIRVQIAPNLPQLVADERACRQILINLLTNAVKFSHPGGEVGVTLKRQGQQLNLSVIDTGIGMDSGAVDRVGEAFFQANCGLDREHEGTGLGLSIVKGLVDLHGGALRTVSELGAGTTMTVLLPLNGPETKSEHTGSVTVLHRESESTRTSQWQDEKRKAL